MCPIFFFSPVDASFWLIWINIKEWDVIIRVFSFIKKLPNCLPKWSYHFVFSPVMIESFWCPITSLAFVVVSVLDFSHSKRCVVVNVYFNLQLNLQFSVEHLFICLFSIWISFLVRCLQIFSLLFSWVVCFLIVGF